MLSTFCTLSLWVFPSALGGGSYPPVLQMRKLGSALENSCPGSHQEVMGHLFLYSLINCVCPGCAWILGEGEEFE